MPRASTVTIVLLVLFLTVVPAMAATILVPEQRVTIQAGLNAADSGDTVSVAPGVYLGSVVFPTDGITLLSRVRHAATIDGGGSGHVVSCNNLTCTIEGFTLTGSGTFSGAVFTSQKSQIVRDNVIIDNDGDGIIISSGSKVLIERNSITDGGALDAGIKIATGAEAVILDNYIARNGHGISQLSHSGDAFHSIVHNTIVDNAIAGILLPGPALIEHNIVVGAEYGVFLIGDYSPDLQIASETLSLSYNDVWGNSEADYYGELGGVPDFTAGEFTPVPGIGEISSDPQLDGAELMSISPCIDAGVDPEDFSGTPCVDIEGKARIIDGDGDGAVRADIGAFEFAPGAPVGPGEVESLRWLAASQLEWDSHLHAAFYNVYRGELSALGYDAWGDCLTTVPATTLTEPESPALDSGFFYLVTVSVTAELEGPKGGGSCMIRTNPTPCIAP